MKKMTITTITFVFIGLLSIFFLSPKKDFSRSRTPANTDQKVDQQIHFALSKLKRIDSLETANSILLQTEKDLDSIKQPQAKPLVEVVRLLRHSEGVLFRLEPIIATLPMSSIGIISFLKELKKVTPESASYVHVLIDRLFISSSTKPRYETISQLQKDILTKKHFLSKLISIHQGIEKSLMKYPLDNGHTSIIHLDFSKTLGKLSKFIPKDKSSITITNAHLVFGKIAIEQTISKLLYFSSYNLDKIGHAFAKSYRDNSRHMGFVLFKPTQNFSHSNKFSKMRLDNRIQNQGYKETLTLQPWAKKERTLERSKEWLLKALNSQVEAIILAKNFKTDFPEAGISSDILASVTSKSEKSVIHAIKILSSDKPSTIIDPLTEEKVRINPSIIFTPTLSGIRDLKKLLPNSHEKETTKNIEGHKIINLNYGKPTSWNDPTFSGILPEVTDQSLQKSIKIIGRHPATSVLAAWLAAFQ